MATSGPVSSLYICAKPIAMAYLTASWAQNADHAQVQPLRLAKNNSPSPKRMPGSTPRPLSEISPSEKRRNSPSWNQSTKVRQSHC